MTDRSPESSETVSENPYAAPWPVVVATAADCERPPCSGSRPVVLAICGLLVLAVLLVFCQTGAYDFVNFDDDHYVYDNEHLNHGFTWSGLLYYSYHWHAYTYHPLATYSHMLDCQLFGLKAGGHHSMNVALHAITAVLLFLLLRQMTGRLWPCALAAALFAIHPLRVESVAWISERKDVLSGLFFVLTLGAYVRYVRAPSAAGRYATVCVLYVLGLLAKPMLVTLPMVLLLLDYWPLRRWQAFWHLLTEKMPLLLLSAAACVLTVRTQVAAIQSLEAVSWPARSANVLVAYVNYLGCFFWPQGLAILYPHPINGFSVSMVLAAALLLVAVSAGALAWRRRAPYLLVGWLWYLGMLIPVIGLLQVGGQKMADRYTYLPQIGLVFGLVWAATDLANWFAARKAGCQPGRSTADWQSAPRRRLLRALPIAGIVAAFAVGAWRQATYWRDSETLWVRDTMYPNLVGRYNLGLALAAAQRHEEAIQQFEMACKISATDDDTLYSYAVSLEALGRVEEAAAKYRAALAVNKKSVNANDRLARILLDQGKDCEALTCWQRALQEDPTNAEIQGRLKLYQAGKPYRCAPAKGRK